MPSPFFSTRPSPLLLAVRALVAALASAGALAQGADLALGERIAREGLPPQVAACVSCHGARGEGSAAFPPLAGAGPAYLTAQLQAFADGSRKQAVMGPIAKALEPAQRASVAAWFASLAPALAPVTPARAEASDRGAWLATRGRWKDGIPACAQCHGPGGAGVPPHFPPIGGLSAAYMQEQVEAWKAGIRPPGPLGLMESVAKQLSADDVSAVAGYYAKLHAAPRADEARP
ncbi:MAG: c-type cytochrome [Burkholderiaceae bacterium]|nr:c-type cytochrome [Burkholderiaceae bacterium]